MLPSLTSRQKVMHEFRCLCHPCLMLCAELKARHLLSYLPRNKGHFFWENSVRGQGNTNSDPSTITRLSSGQLISFLNLSFLTCKVGLNYRTFWLGWLSFDDSIQVTLTFPRRIGWGGGGSVVTLSTHTLFAHLSKRNSKLYRYGHFHSIYASKMIW